MFLVDNSYVYQVVKIPQVGAIHSVTILHCNFSPPYAGFHPSHVIEALRYTCFGGTYCT